MGVALKFTQGIPAPLVFSNWSDNQGVADELGGFTAVFQIRQLIDRGAALISKTTADGSMAIALIEGLWTISVNFSDADMALMVPIVPHVEAPFFDANAPAYLFGLWELRMTSDGGIPARVARGPAYIELSVINA